MTQIEIRPGPLGVEGGEPFPEVREEIERMEKGSRLMRPSLMRLVPNTLIVKLMRKMMGFPNKDIVKGPVETRHLSIPGPAGDIPVRLYRPKDVLEGTSLPVMLYYHGGNFATVCCLLAHERSGPAISHQVLIYPGVDLSGRYDEEHGPQEGSEGMGLGGGMASVYVDRPGQLADPRCSPWLAEDVSFMPPALVMTAEYCFIRDQGEAYARKLAAAGVPTRAIRYNGLNHAFLDKVGVWPYADACIEDIAKVLNSESHCRGFARPARPPAMNPDPTADSQ
jgi:acetyl esterase/lipase